MAMHDIHEDIIKTHILTKLDGQTLAATGCTSTHLQTLCSDQTLWSTICTTTYPSTVDPLTTTAISAFSSAHRTFFSDASSAPTHRLTTTTTPPPPTTHIISSVDLKYHQQLIFSKVESTNTTPTDWFQTSPFRIDLLEPKELVLPPAKLPVPVSSDGADRTLLSDLETHMTLSWIVIDPTQKRAVNLSSVKPVSVQQNWLTNGIELTFSVVVEKDNDFVNCNVQITCGVNEDVGELTVSGVSLTVVDVYGKCLSGRESMVILQGVAAGVRRRRGGVEAERRRYGEFIDRRREINEKRERRERWVDMACVASGVVMLMAFWSFVMW